MKKLIFIITLFFTLPSFSQNNFIEFDITSGDYSVLKINDVNNNERPYGEGFMIGCSTKIYGVYFGFGTYVGNHLNDVRVDKWRGQLKGYYFHVGYNIQLFRFLSFTPIVGYSDYEVGDVDGWNWRGTSTGIENHFEPYYKDSSFDFGGQISFDIPCSQNFSITIPATITKQVTYFGLGMRFYINNY